MALRASVSPWWKLVPVLVLALIPAQALRAVSLIPPRTLAEMAGGARTVVLARAGESHSVRRGALYYTRTDMTVLESLSGALLPGSRIAVQAPGGEIDGEGWFVPGSPRFAERTDYLLCLNERRDGLWQPAYLGYGILRREAGNDGTWLLVPLEEFSRSQGTPTRPDGDPVEPVAACEERPLVEHLARVLGGRETWDVRAVLARPENVARGSGAGVPAGCTYFSSNGMNMRWPVFDSGGSIGIRAEARGDLSIEHGGFRLIQDAMQLWMGITGNGVNLFYEGTDPVTFDCETGGNSRGGMIIFNDPCDELDPGTLAVGGPSYSGTHAFDGASWISIQGWFVVVNDGSGSLGDTGYTQMLAHELGHGLGFGHADDPNAMMYGACCHAPNSTDIQCVRYTYPPVDPANRRPQPDAGGNRLLVLAGDTAPLRGVVTDDGLPGGAIATTWRRLAGPGSVTFGDARALETTATFGRSGVYQLGLAAHDGELLRVSQARVNVMLFAGSTAEATFSQNAAGYQGTTDTTLSESSPGRAAGNASTVGVDGDDPADSGLDSQGLLRFDDLFGSGPGKVPPGIFIRAATLDLTTADTGSGAVLHRMLSGWTEGQSWSAFGGNGIQPGSEAFAIADASASGAEGAVRVDVLTSLQAWARAPCSNQGWALLPVGSDGWDFSSSESASPPALIVDYASVPRRSLIALGDRWSYFKGTASPPAAWRDIDFPATGWLSGSTGIGYGDGDDATVLGDMRNRYATVYCRRIFDVPDPAVVGRLILEVDYDDGFVAYLNGVEAARSVTMGEPGSPVNRNTLAASRDAGVPETFRLDRSLLVAGQNVLAVEVHNSSLDSSDLSFLPELAVEELLVPEDAEWRFLRGSLPRPPDWTAIDFDDDAWETAAGSLGFGNGDAFTVIDDMLGAYVGIAARTSFVVGDPGLFPSLRLTVIHDDGVVLYLNGTEVGRVNMPDGEPDVATEALASVEPAATSFDVPGTLLIAGRNVLAASIHNADLANSDLSFACVLAPPLTGIEDVDCGPEFRRGDVQDDGSVDLSDALKILLHLFAGAGSLPCPDAADTDDDGVVELSDAIGILDFIFRSRAAPAAPGPVCGTDPTSDDLPGCVSLRCGG